MSMRKTANAPPSDVTGAFNVMMSEAMTTAMTTMVASLMGDNTTSTNGSLGGGGAGAVGAAPRTPPEYVAQARLVCEHVLIPLVCTLGIMGNVFSLLVLTRKEMTSPTNCFLVALAVSDLMLLVGQIPNFLSASPSIAAQPSFQRFFRHYTLVRYFWTNVFINCTCWITVAVTIERFLSLRFMMHPWLACTMRRAKIAIAGIFIFALVFHFSKFFEYVPNPDLSSSHPLLPTALVRSPAYDSYIHVANISLTAILPVVALVVFNSFLIFFLATHRRRMLKHKAGSLTSVDMMHISVIVVAMVLVFLVCHSLGVFLALTISILGRHAVFANPLFIAFKYVNNLLVMVNSSVNFLLYCAISRKFRTTCAAMLGSCRRGRGRHSSYSTSVPMNDMSTGTLKHNGTSFMSHTQSAASSNSSKNGENQAFSPENHA